MFKLEFRTTGSAFTAEDRKPLADELTYCLNYVAIHLREGDRGGYVRDSNGSTIGAWAIMEE